MATEEAARREIDAAQTALQEMHGVRQAMLPRFFWALALMLGCWLLIDWWVSPPSSWLHLLWITSFTILCLLYILHRHSARFANLLLVLFLIIILQLMIAYYSFHLIWPLGLVIIIISMSILQPWEAGLAAILSWTGSVLVSNATSNTALNSASLGLSALAYALVLGAVLVSQAPMRESATLAHWAWEELRRAVLEARTRRAELHRVVRALEEATYRIERMNNELMLARYHAEIARANKARFAAMVSHELRGPLNLILGFSRLMALSPEKYGVPLPAAYRADVMTIYSSSRHVANLLDDVLDLSQLEAERMPLVKEQVSVEEVIRDVERIVRPLAERKGLAMSVTLDHRDATVTADRTRLRQVLFNLLTNATRFTDHGSIGISCEISDDEVVVSVHDTGRGIPETELPRLFEEFSQLHLPDQETKGSGLGLAISKHLVELHGGRIWAESEHGVGTTVRFALPHRRAASTTRRTKHGTHRPLPEPHETVIVVHDNPTIVRLLARHLGDYHVVGVPDPGAVAAEVRDHHPRAVIAVPESGDAIHQSLVQEGLCVPLLLCSPSHLGSSPKLESAFTYLIKPVTREMLEATVRKTPCRGEELVVLCVDDDPDAVRLLEVMLSTMPEPCRVLRAYDGEQALSIMHQDKPDLVLMDLVMPGMSGEEAVRRIRNDPALSAVPVAIVSASDTVDSAATLGDWISLHSPRLMTVREGASCLRALLDQVSPDYLSPPTTS